ncbi:MAG: hypothetical protein H7222_17020 [Methylotenera sp.]|nr:hypothetical protein [Oligoflexia bacterium]
MKFINMSRRCSATSGSGNQQAPYYNYTSYASNYAYRLIWSVFGPSSSYRNFSAYYCDCYQS